MKKILIVDKKRIFVGIFLSVFVFCQNYGSLDFLASLATILKAQADTAADENDSDDYDLYKKYIKYKNYEKRKLYRKYKEYKEKYDFNDSKEKFLYKERYEQYKLYMKDPKKYARYGKYWDYYKRYRNYKEKYQEYKEYKKYKNYNKKNYGWPVFKKYGTKKYRDGYRRYKAKQKNGNGNSVVAEADLGGGNLGPTITVGLWSYSKTSLNENPFRLNANKDYMIKDRDGHSLAIVPAATSTKVKYSSGVDLLVTDSILDKVVSKEVVFEAADGNNENMIFDANKPSSSLDRYRGKISVRFSDDGREIWVINTLPLEHYVWGMGEITGTGPEEYNKLMTTSYRTYGYWKIKYSTKYATKGFKVTPTSSSQVYYGYDWEIRYPRIKEAALVTRGMIVTYKDRIAITPYSSWTDGRTRSWEERWGSDNYHWCQSVKDPYGKHPTMSAKELEDAGNHMVGLSAHGALKLADDEKWDWQRILKYYYKDITLHTAYF